MHPAWLKRHKDRETSPLVPNFARVAVGVKKPVAKLRPSEGPVGAALTLMCAKT